MSRPTWRSAPGFALIALAAGCNHAPSPPSSCLIQKDDGKPLQCFDYVGSTTKENASTACSHLGGGKVVFQADKGCPSEGRAGSCRMDPDTPAETIESCYFETSSCKASCEQQRGAFTPK